MGIRMIGDNKKVIVELKQKLGTYEKDYVELQQLNENKQKELQDNRREAHSIEGLITTLETKLRQAKQGIGSVSVRLHTVEKEQEILERQQQIQQIKSQHLTFLDLVGEHLQELEDKQQQGRKLPLEIEVNAEEFKTKLAALDTIDYIKTYGMSPAYQTYRDTKKAYEEKLEQMIGSHLDGMPSLMFSYEDYVPYAQNFIRNNHIRSYLQQ